MTLAHLRDGDTLARLTVGSPSPSRPCGGICARRSTCSRRTQPTSPTPPGGPSRLAYAILDETMLPIDRIADQRPCYSGKHKRHGVTVQVLADPAGRLVWASPALPGVTHDLTAARNHGLNPPLTSQRDDLRGQGISRGGRHHLDTVQTRRTRLSRRQKTVNHHHANIRALGERAIAVLNTWKVLPSCAAAHTAPSGSSSTPKTTLPTMKMARC
jgi:hypothetical protein